MDDRETRDLKHRYLRALKEGISQSFDWGGLDQETLKEWRIEYGLDDETARDEDARYLARYGGIHTTTWGSSQTGE